jgi:calmodulin
MKLSEDDIADFEEAFELFDKDGDGTISTAELKNVLRCFGKTATDTEVNAILQIHGKNESEDIYFDEFKLIMAQIMQEPEVDEEIFQVYKVFARDDQRGVDHK